MKETIKYKGTEYKIFYRHKRDYEMSGEDLLEKLDQHLECCEAVTKEDLKDILYIIRKQTMLPTGGETICFIKLDDVKTIEAKAECSELDVYNRELGRLISFGRLVKKLKL